jgi:hypothetical protein
VNGFVPPGGPPILIRIVGNPIFQDEREIAYEAAIVNSYLIACRWILPPTSIRTTPSEAVAKAIAESPTLRPRASQDILGSYERVAVWCYGHGGTRRVARMSFGSGCEIGADGRPNCDGRAEFEIA